MWRERCNVVGRACGFPLPSARNRLEDHTNKLFKLMTKSLLRLLTLWLAPVLVLAIGGGYLFAGQPPGPRAVA